MKPAETEAEQHLRQFGSQRKRTKFFDDDRSYKFRHLQERGMVRDRADLGNKIKFGFPSGRLLTPRDRQWTGLELNEYLDSCPTTQAELDSLPDRPAKTKPDIPKKPPSPTQPPKRAAKPWEAPEPVPKGRRGRPPKQKHTGTEA